ncbi:GL25008 [Drosophila persimilis]|uniref:GL25008 n=2 Tax=Drosophila persimilis TaxID=7234 RepID=B4GR77_DROPE|nr:GL25008 [Drosophila persimilis]
MDIPAYTQQTATQARQFRHRHHKQRQLSNGASVSYENQLATASSEDELDDAEVVVVGSPEVVAAVAAIATNKARGLRNRSGSYSNLFDADFEAALVNSALAEGQAGAEAAGGTATGSTDVFKPSAGAALLAVAMGGDHALASSASKTENMYSNVPHVASASNAAPPDAALHVYSNIIDERAQQHQREQLQATTVLSSTLLSDDLDLDDPVSASFVAAHSQRKSIGDGAEQAKSADRLRMLHDTTMIDTALDLDSLDGSSMGNNSQSCLVKSNKPTASGSNVNIV